MKRFLSSCARLPRVAFAVGLCMIVASSAAFPRHAAANPIYAYDNSAPSTLNSGDRINTPTRGRAQAFVAATSGTLAAAVFGLRLENATTGTLHYALYNVAGTGPYAIGSQVGSTGVFSTLAVNGTATNLDVRSLNWELTSGNKYAVALWSDATDWNNPDGSAGGVAWWGGASSTDNLTVFNNWGVGANAWEDWGNTTSGFSLALQPVPEPSTCVMALAGLACGGSVVFRRRRAR